MRILEATVETEDGLTYDEPEPWHRPARHVLGAILLEMDRAGDAVRVYREALEDHPRNGWSLFGLEQALRAQGKDGRPTEYTNSTSGIGRGAMCGCGRPVFRRKDGRTEGRNGLFGW